MNIAVTGSRGFIGRHLARKLRTAGHKVISIDRPCFDLLKPAASLSEALSVSNVIFHLATITLGSAAEVIDGNVNATRNLLQAIKSAGKMPDKIIFTSSIHADSQSLYGHCKKAAELLFENFAYKQGVAVEIFRLTHIFGEWSQPYRASVVATFCHQAVSGSAMTINDGSVSLKPLYVGDLVRKLVKKVSDKPRQLFRLEEISGENEMTVGELAALIKSFRDEKQNKRQDLPLHRQLFRTYQWFSGSNPESKQVK